MNKIMKTVFGSKLYGLSTPTSDTDYKGIYLPTLEELLLGTYKPYINLDTNKKGKNGAEDVDEEYIALPTFIQLAKRGEAIALDMLHSNVAEYDTGADGLGHIWVSLQNNRHRFYTKYMKAYLGFLKGQISKNRKKGEKLKLLTTLVDLLSQHKGKKLSGIWNVLPTNNKELAKGLFEEDHTKGYGRYWEVYNSKYQENITVEYAIEQIQLRIDNYGKRANETMNKGHDWKSVHHGLRLGNQLIDIYTKGYFNYPLDQTDLIKEVKAGLHDYETVVEPELNRLLDTAKQLGQESDYLEVVDTDYWDKWLLSVYNDEFILGELWDIKTT